MTSFLVGAWDEQPCDHHTRGRCNLVPGPCSVASLRFLRNQDTIRASCHLNSNRRGGTRCIQLRADWGTCQLQCGESVGDHGIATFVL